MKRFALPAFAAAVLAPLSAFAADTYVIEPTHSFARASYQHMGISTAQIRFDSTSGTITLDKSKKSGSADITIDVNSIDSGVDKFDAHLKSEDLFDAAKYPTITFKSKDFQFSGEQLSAVGGDLTIHGVTKPVTLKVTSFACREHPMRKVPVCGADAEAMIKRSDFGVGYGVPMVGDEVALSIVVEALKQ